MTKNTERLNEINEQLEVINLDARLRKAEIEHQINMDRLDKIIKNLATNGGNNNE